MMSGGWGYVWASYGIVWAVIVVYGWSLFARARQADIESGPDGGPR